MSQTLAVAGATGAVGTIVLQLLEKMQLPVDRYKFLASQRSAGKQIDFLGEPHVVELLEPAAFRDVDIVIASTPDDVAVNIGKWAVDHDAVVIDESGAHRMLEQVPLIVPEVNAEAVTQHQGIIASPNCSTTQMVVALKPLHDAAKVKRVIVSTYQATSGAGVPGQTELVEATRARLENLPFVNQAFAYDISFNCIPQIGSSKHEGYTSEEMKMVWETQKIFADPDMQVCPTCVRVPVENCHSESIVAETEQPLSVDIARDLFQSADGIRVIDNLITGEYPMPSNCDGLNEVFVGRIRKDISCDNGIAFWCVSDNLRKGAATNAVQIAELLLSGKFTPCST